MDDTATIWLSNAEKTRFCGESLAQTLYDLPVTIILRGDLGAGKTTFLQGFANSLGISDYLTSPTYALEQRYRTARHGEFLHLDLYRLNPEQAQELIAGTDDHEGIRCIEWADRLRKVEKEGTIEVELVEGRQDLGPRTSDLGKSPKSDGRTLTITFHDLPLPSSEQIMQWREEVMLPDIIREHCDAVASFADRLAQSFLERTTIVRTLALQHAAETHDLLRFLDFKKGTALVDVEITDEEQKTWNTWKDRYPNMGHEEACAAFLRDRDLNALASIVEVHGLRLPSPKRSTIEQKILFYADKRVKGNEIVSLAERFADFSMRYGKGNETEEGRIWYDEVQKLELELFPDGPPL